MVEIEIGHPLPTLVALDEQSGRHYQRALCLVRLHTRPLGVVEVSLSAEPLEACAYVQQIWSALSTQINDHLHQDGLPAVSGLDVRGLVGDEMPPCLVERQRFLTQAPFVSVIVPTHDRPDRIQLCLHSLLALDYPRYEIIVVDNAPSSSATADFIEHTYRDVPQVRYLREERPGPSWARNCGMMAATGEILAFTDDDIVVDRYWLLELVKGFSLEKNVACVTGLVLPLELETPSQLWLEEYGGFSKGFDQRIFDMREHRPKLFLYPYTVGLFGTGGSMAFRSEFIRRAGGFDPVLGGRNPALCAEDTDIFFRAIIQNHQLVYTPASIVYHLHHRDYTSLCHQIYHYGVGLTAYLMKSVLNNPWLLFDLITKLPYGFFFILSTRSLRNSRKSPSYPKELTSIELKGMIHGPFAYLQSRWQIHFGNQALTSANSSIALPIAKET